VAHLTARKLRAVTARRWLRERQVTELPEPASESPSHNSDWYALLDQEVHRLPARYRAPVVLCDLEGKTRKEAARQLGWPEGSVSSRLARARALLARRLARQGLAGVAAPVVISPAKAAVPAALAAATVRAAGLLVTGKGAANGIISARVVTAVKRVLLSLWLARLKTALPALVFAGVVVAGAGWLTHGLHGAGAPQSEGSPGGAPAAVQPHLKRQTDLLDVRARGDRVVLGGYLIAHERLDGEADRATFHLEGTTKALILEGTGTNPARLQTSHGPRSKEDRHPELWYIPSGPIQIKGGGPGAADPGTIALESRRCSVSATGVSRPEETCRLVISAAGDGLLLQGMVRGQKLEAQADRAQYDAAAKCWLLESKGLSRVRLETAPGKPGRELSGRTITYSFRDGTLFRGEATDDP
jgi:hypothetical protein